jgi:hypothetical protein
MRQYGLFRYFSRVLPCGLIAGKCLIQKCDCTSRADECSLTLNQSMTGTAEHHPSLVKKAVVAYETGDTDRHVGKRGVTASSHI